MAAFTRLAALAALLASSANLVAGVATKGSGTTTRYWDCCKPSCAWSMSGLTAPVKTCDISDKPLAGGVTAQSGCQGGTSFMCSDQSPWAVNDNLAYGFAAVTAANPACCTCYKLTFTSTSIAGKTMIVQATNTGNDVSGTQFDLAMPGGGFGQFDGCSKEWKATSATWGAQYGGSNTNTCSAFPAALQKGCGFRWDWMKGQSNPNVDYEQITCPAELVAKSGCSVSGYVAPGGGSGGTSTSIAPGSPPATTKVTTAPTHTPTQKASSTSTSTAPEGSSVDATNSSLATGAGIGGFVSETGTGTATAPLGTGTGTTGATGEGGEEDDTCEL
ncbi:MAG: hypothetical protein Q9220_005249 [cf. Caloplaca sp. 1 TL-2023]